MATRTIKIKLGDDNNKDYSRTIELTMSEQMYDALRNYTKDYDYAWDSMCEQIEDENRGLPRSWFIDKITW